MLAQQLLNGLTIGAIYALFALGFNLVFGIHKVLNLAHGAIFMSGAFVGLYAVLAGLPLWIALFISFFVGGLLSIAIDFIAFRPLRHRGDIEFAAIISSIGADMVLTNVAQRVSQTQVLRFPFGTFPVKFWSILGLRISLLQIAMIAALAILTGLLALFLYRTSAGRQIRAVAGNERAAALLGIDASLAYMQTFLISGGLAGIAGVLVGLAFNSVHFLMGEPFLLRGFVVLILGGLGSLPGAVLAGLLLGMTQTLTVAYLSSGLSDAIIFSLLFLTLLVRPQGLFGSRIADTRVARR